MAEKTGIAWARSTRNFWAGCTKIGPAEWKEFIVYFIYFVAAIFLINWLLGLTGHSFITLR